MHKALFLLISISILNGDQTAIAQNYQGKSVAYNVVGGAIMGGAGAVINKAPQQKWYKAFLRGFLTGACGGGLTFTGKKMNKLIADNQQLGYAYLSRAVFSAGNSIIENAAANRNFYEVFHYDIGFVRIQYNTRTGKLLPRVMVSSLGSTVFLAANGRFDFKTTVRSGSMTFRTPEISYSPNFRASTPGNGFLFVDSLQTGAEFYKIYAHEMIHSFQFQEYSPITYFFKPWDTKWKERSPTYNKLSKYFFADVNYEFMLGNYFLIQKGHKKADYCHNFLENEAESLSTGRSACP